MTQFKPGETFRPVGPPSSSYDLSSFLICAYNPIISGKKRKRLSSTPDISQGAPIANLDVGGVHPGPSENHPRDQDLHPPLKRRREEQPTTSPISPPLPSSVTRPVRSHGPRPLFLEVIPDSDEETNTIQSYLSPKRQEREVVEVIDTDETFDPLFDEPKTKVPEHISRRENPLVKMVDPGTMNFQGAIAAKVRALREPDVGSSSQVSPRVKPGPGRSSGGLLIKQKAKSSLFTAEKGAVKIIKGKYRKEDAGLKDQEPSSTILPGVETSPTKEDSNKPVPSGDELLQLAGLDQTATDLADFEDPEADDGVPVDNSATEAVIQPVQTSLGSTGTNESSTIGSGYAVC
jgi:hypothetical protein